MSGMRRTILLFVMLLISAAQYAVAGGTIRRLDGSRISFEEASNFARTTLAAHNVTGAQLVIIDRGKLLWSEAFGNRGLDPALPMERTTMTWAGSLTKGVFATYVMQLAERGELDLELPVARQLAKPLDEYELYAATASLLVKDPQWQLVTPAMLLSHTAGLRNFAWLEPDKKMHINSVPGSVYAYSGEGINLLQFLIEQKKGRPIEDLMQDALFTPLGMTRSGMIYRKEFEGNIADRFDAEGKFIGKTRRSPAHAAGSLTTTAEDLARFFSALFNDRIIKPATRRAMLRPRIAIRALHQFALVANEPQSEEAARVGLAYGSGWGLLTSTKFGPAFFKEGHGDGAQNYVICFERRQACMILLTNSGNGELAFRPLLEHIFGDTVTPWEWEGYTPSFIEISRKNGN
jgi:CubicO group peptidase (beta-lactamase class C family)